MPLVGMVSVSLLAHNLSEPDFGNWILFLITFTLANFFRAGFLQTSLVKLYAGAEINRKINVVGSTWFVAMLLTSALGFLSLFIYYFFSKDTSAGMIAKWFGIIFFSTLPSSIALWVLQAEERFDQIFILQLIGQGTFFISIITLIVLHKANFQVVIYAYCWSAILTSLISVITGWAKIQSIPRKSRECIMKLVNFGKYSVFTSISSYLLRGSDTFIIKFMFVDPAIVAVYYLPQRLMEVIEIPLRSFIATALPAMSAALQRNDNFVIEIIGGSKFVHSDAANVFRIFMSFAILLPVDRFFGITLDLLNKPHLNLIKVMLMLIVNVVGDFVGIYLTHNLYGVALSSIFTFLAGIVYGYWVLKKNLKFKIHDIFKLGMVETKLVTVALISRLSAKNG